MAKFSQGMTALDHILGMNSKEAETFIRSTIGDSAGVKKATDVVGDMRYYFAKAAGAGGRSEDFINEIGSLGQYGYSAEDAKKLLTAARNLMKPTSGASTPGKQVKSHVYAPEHGLDIRGNTNSIHILDDASKKSLQRHHQKESAKRESTKNNKAAESSPEPPTTPTANSSTAGSAEPSSVIENYKGFSAEEKEELAKALGSDVSKIDQLITNAEQKENPTFTTGFTNEVNAIIGRRAGQKVESAASKSAQNEPGTSSPEPSTTPTANSSSIYDDIYDDNHNLKPEARARLEGNLQSVTGNTSASSKAAEPAPQKAAEPPVNAASEPTAAAGSKENPDNDQFGFGGKEYDEARQEAADAKAPIPRTAPEPSGKPPDDYYDAGIGKERLDKITGNLNQKIGDKNTAADLRTSYERKRDEFKNFDAQLEDLKKQNLSKEDYMKKRDEIYKEHGFDPKKDIMEQVETKIAEAPTTWDWINGNKVIQKAGGTLLLGGAVASCFSNKGRMSNSELYGQNF